MANNYTQASFLVPASAEEITATLRAAELIDTLAHAYQGEEDDAKSALEAEFPGLIGEIFDDPDFPELRCQVQRQEDMLWFGGEDMDVQAVANLIARTAPSVLPFGFEYANTCSKLRVGEFGGGIMVIRADGTVVGENTSTRLDALMREEA